MGNCRWHVPHLLSPDSWDRRDGACVATSSLSAGVARDAMLWLGMRLRERGMRLWSGCSPDVDGSWNVLLSFR